MTNEIETNKHETFERLIVCTFHRIKRNFHREKIDLTYEYIEYE